MNNLGPILPPATKKTKSRLARFEKRIGYLNALLLKLGLWLIILLSLGMLWREYHRSYYLIQPIEVPQAMEELGYTPTVMAQRIFDELLEFVNESGSVRDFQGFSADQRTAQVDFQVAGFGLSVQSLATQLRTATGKTERIIQGEVVDEGDALALRMRIPGKRIPDIKVDKKQLSATIDSITKQAAFELFKITEPYLYAVHLNAEEKNEEALVVARGLLNDPDERKWGLNLIGNIEKVKNGNAASIFYYKLAMAEDEDFRLPVSNLAYTYQAMDSLSLAYEYFEKSIDIQPMPQKMWIQANYYMALIKEGRQTEKVNELRKELLTYEEPDLYSFCANSASDRGLYEEALTWCEKSIVLYPTNFGINMTCSMAAAATGKKEKCLDHLAAMKKFNPENPSAILPEVLISLLDKDLDHYEYLIDSVNVHHPRVAANTNGMILLDLIFNIYKGNEAEAQTITDTLVSTEGFDIRDFKEIYFTLDILPYFPDSLQTAWKEMNL